MVKFSFVYAIALLAIAFAVEVKSTAEPTERVFGGAFSRPGQFPYQVSLKEPRGSIIWHFCGGAIISDQFVLTTAKCTQGPRSHPPNVTVVVGTNTIQPLDS